MKSQREKTVNRYAFLFPVGIGIGVAVGAAIHNMGVGLAIGAAVGTIFSLLFERRNG